MNLFHYLRIYMYSLTRGKPIPLFLVKFHISLFKSKRPYSLPYFNLIMFLLPSFIMLLFLCSIILDDCRFLRWSALYIIILYIFFNFFIYSRNFTMKLVDASFLLSLPNGLFSSNSVGNYYLLLCLNEVAPCLWIE